MVYNTLTCAGDQLPSTSTDPSGTSTSGQKTVMLMVEPGMAPTPVKINVPVHAGNSNSSTSASEANLLTDAAESLQALAEVVESAAAVEPITAAELLEQTQQVIEGNDNHIDSNEQLEMTVESENPNENDTKEDSEVHLTSDQLMNLEAGDYIEINGETYKVEFQMDSQ